MGPSFFEEKSSQLLNTDLWDRFASFQLMKEFVQLHRCFIMLQLNEHFPDRWIDHGSHLIDWLPRSYNFGFLSLGIFTHNVYKN